MFTDTLDEADINYYNTLVCHQNEERIQLMALSMSLGIPDHKSCCFCPSITDFPYKNLDPTSQLLVSIIYLLYEQEPNHVRQHTIIFLEQLHQQYQVSDEGFHCCYMYVFPSLMFDIPLAQTGTIVMCFINFSVTYATSSG